ncbi:MAG TPA: S8 family serine peptidase [Gemmatimonadales bacterium]|nr:S8 family serine peptidase [Gemmatimonadales bacterium]
MPSPRMTLAALAFALACAPKQPEKQPEPNPKEPSPELPLPKPNIDPGRLPPKPTAAMPEPDPYDTLQPVVPPDAAFAHGWMPLASTGVNDFLKAHPTFDGRGVIIGILDTGIDPGIPGLSRTSTDSPKLLDLRDFSDEGAVPLKRVTPAGDSIEIAGRKLGGFGRVTAFNTGGPYYAGLISELPLGAPPAADLNGNGTVGDSLILVVTKASDGWVMFADTDGDRSLAGEKPVHDYLLGRESFGWARRGGKPIITLAANFSVKAGEPELDLVFDSFGHGSHVAGIAAGNDLYGVGGFDGVAPGAQLLGLKIANSAQGSITTTGSMIRAIDYAIRFAEARRLPLVLNLSFGVGNEIEGQVRIDDMIDSVLAANPRLVFTIAAGNDGPGLSTVGFPGSARRAISVGATVPGTFQAADRSGARPEDQLAYFSSRGGELARPEIVTPGVAYSSVPRWNTGEEIAQGTSMASPHAAGLATLLVSASAQEKRPVEARAIKQALMVTAQPLQGNTFVDEGTGLPDIEAAYNWLKGSRAVPDILVKAVGSKSVDAAYLEIGSGTRAAATQQFELRRPASTASATYALRSDSPWLTAPAKVTLTGAKSIVQVRYNLAALKPPGAYVGTITGWGPDSMAGPAFRLVNTIVVPAEVTAGTGELRSGVPVESGGVLRTFFRADSARPFQVRVSSRGPAEKGLVFLHEPAGVPYRDESARPLGGGSGAALYQVDARDVVAGTYEAVAVAPTPQAINVGLQLIQSPLRLHLGRTGDEAVGTLSNVTAKPVTAQVAVLLGGGERVETVAARGSDVRRIPFVAPAWARTVVVDISMDRAQWGRFTDFGVTLFDSAGRQIEKKPLNYAVGRLQAALPEGHGDMPVELGLFPGFADPAGSEQWTLKAAIRLYADTAIALAPRQVQEATVTLAPSKSGSVSFSLPQSPWPLGDGFFPLGILVARAAEHTWTREGGLSLPEPAPGR